MKFKFALFLDRVNRKFRLPMFLRKYTAQYKVMSLAYELPNDDKQVGHICDLWVDIFYLCAKRMRMSKTTMNQLWGLYTVDRFLKETYGEPYANFIGDIRYCSDRMCLERLLRCHAAFFGWLQQCDRDMYEYMKQEWEF